MAAFPEGMHASWIGALERGTYMINRKFNLDYRRIIRYARRTITYAAAAAGVSIIATASVSQGIQQIVDGALVNAAMGAVAGIAGGIIGGAALGFLIGGVLGATAGRLIGSFGVMLIPLGLLAGAAIGAIVAKRNKSRGLFI